MDAATDLDLLLIGKTGNGKSHTGNSILKRRVFRHRSSSTSVTTEVESDVSEYKGRIVKVVDGPGIGDTRLDNVEATKLVVKAMEDAIRMNSRGYHALLLVVRFGGRFTKEDVDTIGLLKKIFGESIVRDFCILVMTCGDSFAIESEDTGESFQQWCQNQEGVLKQLLEECCGRIVLFNNVTRDEKEKNDQLDRLISTVHGLAARGHRYSDNLFKQARDERQRAIVESKKQMISEASVQECSLILQQLDRARAIEDPNGQLKMLNTLLERTSNLQGKIHEEAEGTDALQDVEENVKNIYQSIQEAISVHKKVEKEKEELKRREAEMKADVEKRMQKQQQQFDAQMKREQRSWEDRLKMQKQLDDERQKMEAEAREECEKRNQEILAQLNGARAQLESKVKELENARIQMQRKRKKSWFEKLVSPIIKLFSW